MFRGFAGKLFKTSPRFHTGGVVRLKAGEVPALLTNEHCIPLKPGESKVVAAEIKEIKDKTAKAKEAHVKKLAAAAAEKALDKAGWDAWHDSVDNLQRMWEEKRDEQIAALPMHDPYMISQDEKGWWRVAPAAIHVSGEPPEDRSFGRGTRAPECKVGSCHVSISYKAYEPTFKSFTEASDFAKETALLGKHTYSVDDHGDIVSCSDPEGLAHLAPIIQASKDAQVREADRTAAYAHEALF